MKEKVKYDSFLNAIERLLSKELGQDPKTDQKMFDYTMKIVDHYVKLYAGDSTLPEDLDEQVQKRFFDVN